MAWMVGEQGGGDGPDLAAETLQREHRGGIADMAGDNLRLDGENAHARRQLSGVSGQ
jgi:hypothetical protein